jgi:hypothetical protein
MLHRFLQQVGIFGDGVVARTFLDPLSLFDLAVVIEVRTEISMPCDLFDSGESLYEVRSKFAEGDPLGGGPRVFRRFAIFLDATDIADTDGAGVMSRNVSADLLDRSPGEALQVVLEY